MDTSAEPESERNGKASEQNQEDSIAAQATSE